MFRGSKKDPGFEKRCFGAEKKTAELDALEDYDCSSFFQTEHFFQATCHFLTLIFALCVLPFDFLICTIFLNLLMCKGNSA